MSFLNRVHISSSKCLLGELCLEVQALMEGMLVCQCFANVQRQRDQYVIL